MLSSRVAILLIIASLPLLSPSSARTIRGKHPSLVPRPLTSSGGSEPPQLYNTDQEEQQKGSFRQEPTCDIIPLSKVCPPQGNPSAICQAISAMKGTICERAQGDEALLRPANKSFLEFVRSNDDVCEDRRFGVIEALGKRLPPVVESFIVENGPNCEQLCKSDPLFPDKSCRVFVAILKTFVSLIRRLNEESPVGGGGQEQARENASEPVIEKNSGGVGGSMMGSASGIRAPAENSHPKKLAPGRVRAGGGNSSMGRFDGEKNVTREEEKQPVNTSASVGDQPSSNTSEKSESNLPANGSQAQGSSSDNTSDSHLPSNGSQIQGSPSQVDNTSETPKSSSDRIPVQDVPPVPSTTESIRNGTQLDKNSTKANGSSEQSTRVVTNVSDAATGKVGKENLTSADKTRPESSDSTSKNVSGDTADKHVDENPGMETYDDEDGLTDDDGFVQPKIPKKVEDEARKAEKDVLAEQKERRPPPVEDYVGGPYMNRATEIEAESHFVTYMGFFLVAVGLMYLLFINRHKFMALVIEGSRSRSTSAVGRRRTGSGTKYHRLDNLEDTLRRQHDHDSDDKHVVF